MNYWGIGVAVVFALMALVFGLALCKVSGREERLHESFERGKRE